MSAVTGIIVFIWSSSSTATHVPSDSKRGVTTGCGGHMIVAPLCFATGGSGIARTTCASGTPAQLARSSSSGAVDRSEQTTCVGLNLMA
eukprot:6832044-Prymnesium_polylepis.2